MAQFRGTIAGQRGDASRLGSKQSGLRVTANGWDAGVSVNCVHNAETGRDEFHVYRTGGSNGRQSDRLIAYFTDASEDVHPVKRAEACPVEVK